MNPQIRIQTEKEENCVQAMNEDDSKITDDSIYVRFAIMNQIPPSKNISCRFADRENFVQMHQ
jgi:hypothetical protein